MESLSESETDIECEGQNCNGCMSRKRLYLVSIPNHQVKELENVIFQVAATPPDMHRVITKVTVHTSWYSKGDKRLIPTKKEWWKPPILKGYHIILRSRLVIYFLTLSYCYTCTCTLLMLYIQCTCTNMLIIPLLIASLKKKKKNMYRYLCDFHQINIDPYKLDYTIVGLLLFTCTGT